MKVVTKQCRPEVYELINGHEPHAHVEGFFFQHAYRCLGGPRWDPTPTTEELILDEMKALNAKLDEAIDRLYRDGR